ncbi:MAG: hypothetical protein MJZ99_00245 [Bacteroidales bacterium]|nr:hypothetical protein [Bacteroidales bacterium]
MKKLFLMTFVAIMAFATSGCMEEHVDYVISYGFSTNYGQYTQETRAAIIYMEDLFEETFTHSGYEIMAGEVVLRDSNMKKASKVGKDLANKADSKVDPTKIEALKSMESMVMRVRVNYGGPDEETVWEKDYSK